MIIRVKGYLTFREVIGDRQVHVDEGVTFTIDDLIARLAQECGPEFNQMVFDPETKGVSRYVAILVNGRHHTHLPDRLNTVLVDGDEVSIFPPIAGG